VDKDFLRKGCKELIRELCRLVDSGESMDRSKFHELCEQEHFIDFLFTRYKDLVQMEYLNKNSSLCKSEVLAYFNNAMSRYGNASVMEEFGLQHNALLLGINFAVHIMEDAEQL